ncbi:hypothetical protein SRABI118_01919 [Massilia sp. Bi118]|uniref:DUF3016 domain-containing protein n=1 Tax=Massilia sp. Bi118 TaxID=2822346 RepID=UPI001E05ADA1|nr:DUF3016 domain-containing protein [Massilia sp. Bi118]CAH0208353.1 hypothetical protein SRABI118_01919 [Massilia sp. Bi118]
MKAILQQLALAGVFALAAGSAAAAVTVTYTAPDKYADVPRDSGERDNLMNDLTDHFTWLGTALPPGQDLRIEVLDIDLAGREEPSARAVRDVRVMRGGADWPRMRLRYAVEANGQVLKSGEAQLSDMDYMAKVSRYSEDQPQRYEKQMIDRWFEKNIAPLPRGDRR